MPRDAVNEKVQIGVEATPGTLVAATRRLNALSFEAGVEFDADEFRPTGSKFPTLVTPTKEWTAFDVAGRVTYDEIVYPASSVFGTATVTPGSGPDAGTSSWRFVAGSGSDTTPKTFTVEEGQTDRAHRAGRVTLESLGFTFDRNNAPELSGSAFGLALEDGITLTAAGVTDTPPVPVQIGEVTVYLDATAGAIGTTKLGGLFDVELELGDRANPVWLIDAALDSFAGVAEGETMGEGSMTLEASAAGMAHLATARAGATRFLRIEAIGPNIAATSVPHRFRLDAAVKIADVDDFGEQDGRRTIGYSFTVVRDGTLGHGMALEVRNALTAL